MPKGRSSGHDDMPPRSLLETRAVWTPETALDWTVPGGLQASRDGRVVVLHCTRPDLAQDRYIEWLAFQTDSVIRPLTLGPGDSLPRLSPDGGDLLFRRRDGHRDQVLVAPLRAGLLEADTIDLGRYAGRLRDIAWRPDGAGAAFLVEVHEGHWIVAWDRATGDLDVLASSFLPFRAPAWLSDGRLVVASTIETGEGPGPINVLEVVAPGSDPVIIDGFRGCIGSVVISPRGDNIVFTGVPSAMNQAVSEPHLFRIPLDGGWGAVTDITAHWDRPVGRSVPGNLAPGDTRTLQFSPDGTALYAIVGNQGRSELYRWTDWRRPGERMPDLPWTVLDFAVTQEGLWVVGSTSTEPPELYRWKGRAERVSRLNADRIQERPPVAPEPFVVDGGRFAVSGWRLRPPGEPPYPTVLLLHGGPGGAFGPGFHTGAQLLAAHGYLVLMANPRGSISYGSAFSDAVVGDPGGGDFQDLMAVLDEHLAGSLADPERLAIAGYGYGGYQAAWAITQTDRFQAAVVGAPAINWLSLYGAASRGRSWYEGLIGGPPWQHLELVIERSPVAHVAHVRTPTLIMVGEHDPLYPPSEARQLAAALDRVGVVARLVELRGEGHHLVRPQAQLEVWREMLAWLDHWIPALR